MFQIKIHWDLYLRKLSQREERLRKNCFCVFKRTDLNLGYITHREERLREKRKMSQNSLESASRRAFTERRKTKKKTFSVFSCGLTFP